MNDITDIHVDPELESLLPELSPDEDAALLASVTRDGFTDGEGVDFDAIRDPDDFDVAGESAPTGELPQLRSVQNYRVIKRMTADGPVLVQVPVSITEITHTILRLTDGWPRRVGSALFVPGENHGVIWLDDADAFGAWLGRATGNPAEFKGSPGYHTKREVFANCRMTVQEYAAVEVLPHEPLMANHYYACVIPPPGNGDRLRELVNRFCPETDIDQDLILAMFVTPFWGGRGGCRPGFCLTADEGRGVGKTELARTVAELCGGLIEISANDDGGTIKTRLLSPEAITKRVVLLDNVKTHKLSSAEIEALITSSVISGRRLYVGEGQRANTLTFAMTMNGAGLSTDLAQRTATIKLQRPEYSGTWSEGTRKLIHDHRQELIADIIGFLKSPPVTLAKFTRWGDWERDVLARLPEPSEAQAVIKERQVGVDVDAEESELIESFFVRHISALGYDAITDRVFIPSSVAARWYCWATADKMTTARASRALKQRITEGQMRRLSECPSRNHGRGFEFWGDDATGETYLHTDLDDQIRAKGERHAG